MITVKTIENPEFKNCCEIHADCGKAYVIKQNAKHINAETNLPSLRSARREASVNDETFFRDEFEEMIAFTHQMFDESENWQ